jgi:hypothetical protein
MQGPGKQRRAGMGESGIAVKTRLEASGKPPLRKKSFQQHRIAANCTPRQTELNPRGVGNPRKLNSLPHSFPDVSLYFEFACL